MLTRVLSRPFFLKRGSQTDFESKASTPSKDTADTMKTAPSPSETHSDKKEDVASGGKQEHVPSQAAPSHDTSCCDCTTDNDEHAAPFRYCHDPYRMVKDGVAQPALHADESSSATKQDTSGSFVLVDLSTTTANAEDSDDSDEGDEEFQTPFLGDTDLFAISPPPVADGNLPSRSPSPIQRSALPSVDSPATIEKPTQTVMLSDISKVQDARSSCAPSETVQPEADAQPSHESGILQPAGIPEVSSSRSGSRSVEPSDLGMSGPTTESDGRDIIERTVSAIDEANEESEVTSRFSPLQSIDIVGPFVEANPAVIVSRSQPLSPIPEEDSPGREQPAPVSAQQVLQPSVSCDASSRVPALVITQEQVEETVINSLGAVDLAPESDCTTSDAVAAPVVSSSNMADATESLNELRTDEDIIAIGLPVGNPDQTHSAELFEVTPKDQVATDFLVETTQSLLPAKPIDFRSSMPVSSGPSEFLYSLLPSAVESKPHIAHSHLAKDGAIKPQCPIANFAEAMRDKPSPAHTPERPNWALAPEESSPKPKSTRQSGSRGRGRGRSNGRLHSSLNGGQSGGYRTRPGSQADGKTPSIAVACIPGPVAEHPSGSAPTPATYSEMETITTARYRLDISAGDPSLVVTSAPTSGVPTLAAAPPVIEEKPSTRAQGSSLHMSTGATSSTLVPASLALSPTATVGNEALEKPQHPDKKRTRIPTDGPDQWMKRVNSWMERESPSATASVAPVRRRSTNVEAGTTHALGPSKSLNHTALAREPSYRTKQDQPTRRNSEATNEANETTLMFRNIQLTDTRLPVLPNGERILAPIPRRPHIKGSLSWCGVQEQQRPSQSARPSGIPSLRQEPFKFIDRSATTEERQHSTFLPFPENIMAPPMCTDYGIKGVERPSGSYKPERVDRWLGGAMTSGVQDQRPSTSKAHPDRGAERRQSVRQPLPDPVFQLFPENTLQQTVSMRFEPQGGPKLGSAARGAPPPPPGARSFSLTRSATYSGLSSIVTSHQPPFTGRPYYDSSESTSRPSPARGIPGYRPSPAPLVGASDASYRSGGPGGRIHQRTSSHSQAWRS